MLLPASLPFLILCKVSPLEWCYLRFFFSVVLFTVSSLSCVTGCYRPRAEGLASFLNSFFALRQGQYCSCTASAIPFISFRTYGWWKPLPSNAFRFFRKWRSDRPELRSASVDLIKVLHCRVYPLQWKGFGHISYSSLLTWFCTAGFRLQKELLALLPLFDDPPSGFNCFYFVFLHTAFFGNLRKSLF